MVDQDRYDNGILSVCSIFMSLIMENHSICQEKIASFRSVNNIKQIERRHIELEVEQKFVFSIIKSIEASFPK